MEEDKYDGGDDDEEEERKNNKIIRNKICILFPLLILGKILPLHKSYCPLPPNSFRNPPIAPSSHT